MTRKEFNENIVERGMIRSRIVLRSKNEEYAGEEEVFENFKQGLGISFHTIPEKYTWELLCKHLQSIKDIISDVENNKLPTEDLIDEKFADAHNYLYLIEGMIKERNNGKVD